MTDSYAEELSLITKIKKEIDADPGLYLDRTLPLNESDLIHIGSWIQIYGYADLNARRIIDYLRHAAMGPDKQNAGLLPDAQVYIELNKNAEMLPDAPLRSELVAAAKALEMHRIHRNNFAHWAVRRSKTDDVLVFYNYNSNEAMRRIKQHTKPEQLIYGVVAIRPLQIELRNLQIHSNNLAAHASFIFEHLDKFRQHYLDAQEVQRTAKYEANKFKRGAKGPPSKTN